MFNGFNTSDDISRVGTISLAGSASKSLDTTSMAEGTGSIKVDMPSTNAEFITPYAFYTDVDGDAEITVNDALLILQHSVDNISSFPKK